MYNNNVDGLLVSLCYKTKDIGHFDCFLNNNIPLIFFDRVAQHVSCTNILIDNRKKAYEATLHLIHQGCRKIVHITASLDRTVYRDRLQGYKDALAESHIDFDDDYVGSAEKVNCNFFRPA
jgi:LacI family transcriptional regulator